MSFTTNHVLSLLKVQLVAETFTGREHVTVKHPERRYFI